MFKSNSLTAKFMLGIGVILFCVISIISALFYFYMRELYIKETYQKTDLVLGHIQATMEYVRDELRPQMFHLLPKDEFVREAMSTSFVNKGIMKRFSARFSSYVYRRVAVDPLNPKNRADRSEEEIIRRFSADHNSQREWQGTVSKEGRTYFLRYKAVVMEDQCVMCHGDPARAPKSMMKRYGGSHGYHWKTGDIIGLESIAIPVDETFYQIRQAALFVFLVGLTGMTVLFLFLNYFYYSVAVRPLQRFILFFQHIISGRKGLETRFEVKGRDEIADLADSFNQLVSHLKKTQDDLKASELQYRSIFEGSKDTIIVIDCRGLITDINNSGVELLGYGNKEEILHSVFLRDIFGGSSSLRDFTACMEKDGYVKDYETVFRAKAGSEINVLITATFRKDVDNDVCGYECIIKDITERKRMEQQLRQADKLASIGQLAAGVAHEINNPLSIVLGYTKMLLEDESDVQAKKDLETIRKNAHLCKKIVEDLLNFSRQKKPLCTEADLNETVESVVSVIESRTAGKGLVFVRKYDPALPLITLDADKIKQVCMNILMNARQAITAEGVITVETLCDMQNSSAVVLVSDTGSGIAKEIRDRIFDPFFTTKGPGEGTGLGLAVSYGIIKDHNGEISFESEEGRGAAFRITLPLGRASV
jgi:two-component system NtrC family sensor kinase